MVITLGVFSVIPALGWSRIGIVIPTVFGVHFTDEGYRNAGDGDGCKLKAPVVFVSICADVGMWGFGGLHEVRMTRADTLTTVSRRASSAGCVIAVADGMTPVPAPWTKE